MGHRVVQIRYISNDLADYLTVSKSTAVDHDIYSNALAWHMAKIKCDIVKLKHYLKTIARQFFILYILW